MAKKKKSKAVSRVFAPSDGLEVYVFRGESVVLDQDVARLFGVPTKRLNEQVTRNSNKFRDDFAFRLNKEEFADLRSQNATSSEKWGGVRYPPRVFTEHGVVMAATILKSPQAIDATRVVVRTFVEIRHRIIQKRRGSRVAVSGKDQLTLPLEFRTELMTKVNKAIGHVLDAMINPDEIKQARAEARGVLVESVKGLKEILKKPSLDNEKKVAEIRKIMAEAESIEVATDGKRMKNEERQLALLAKKLSLILQAQHYAQTGSTEGFLSLLNDLDQPKQLLPS